jgi:hypothetical protein
LIISDRRGDSNVAGLLIKLEVKSARIEEKGISSIGKGTVLSIGMMRGSFTAADDHTSTMQTVHHTWFNIQSALFF